MNQFEAELMDARNDSPELDQLLREIHAGIEVTKIPVAAYDFLTIIGTDMVKVSRATQILVDRAAAEALEKADFWGPFDSVIKPQLSPIVRQFLVDFVAKKFDELAASLHART